MALHSYADAIARNLTLGSVEILYIKRLIMRNFRIFAYLDMAFPPGITVIYGDNAQGKTTIIEAIALALTGESPRTSQEREILKIGEKFAVSRAFVKLENSEEHQLEVILTNGKKTWSIDGKARKRGEEGWAPFHIVCFLPQEIQIVSGEPRNRRDFLDKVISHWSYSYHFNLLNYRRVVSQRNALLEVINEQKVSEKDAKERISHWDAQILKYGVKVIETRLEFMMRWQNFVCDVFKELGGEGEIKMRYISSLGDDLESLYLTKREALIERYAQLLAKSLPYDIESTATSIGPHRDDFQVLVNGIDIRDYGSFGQQKLVILALKLSLGRMHQNERKISSIILLDDALSQLDVKRRHMLLEHAKKYEQCIITTTTIYDVPKSFWNSCSLFMAKGGEVIKAK
jgi:DNA replication and repair protein RecF